MTVVINHEFNGYGWSIWHSKISRIYG